jgi:hypothetical protein
MKIIKKSSLFLGITLLLIPSMQCIDYEKQCENLFLNNKTNHRLIVSFCNEDHDEQQQYPIEPQEHRSVRVSAEMMKKLGSVRVAMADRKQKKKKLKNAQTQESQAMQEGQMPEVDEAPQQAQAPQIQQVKELDYDRQASIVGLEMAMISGELDLKWRHSDEYIAAQAPSL